MRTYRFSGTSEAGAFSFDLTSVPDDTTQDEIAEQITDILDQEGIVPEGNVAVRPVVGTSWGTFED